MKQIQKTKDYDQFKRIIGNRPININHVNDLVAKISQNNLLNLFPLVITRDNFLIDGQHRLAAAKANDLEVYYIQATEKLEDIIIALVNSSQLIWRPANYVHFYAERGNEQYIFIEELTIEHKVSIANLVALFTGSNNSTKKLKKGELIVYSTQEEKDLLLDLLAGYLTLRTHLSQVVFNDRDFIHALQVMFQQVSAPQIIEAIGKAHMEITTQSKPKDYLRLFEVIMNRYKTEKSQVRFF